MQCPPVQTLWATRTLCVMLAVFSALGAAARGVDLELCFCSDDRAKAADTCCPDETPTIPAAHVEAIAVADGLEKGYCVELYLTGSETTTEAYRVSAGLDLPELPAADTAVLPVWHCIHRASGSARSWPRTPQTTSIPLRI